MHAFSRVKPVSPPATLNVPRNVPQLSSCPTLKRLKQRPCKLIARVFNLFFSAVFSSSSVACALCSMAKEVTNRLVFEILLSRNKKPGDRDYKEQIIDTLLHLFDLSRDSISKKVLAEISTEAGAFRKRVKQYCSDHRSRFDFILEKYSRVIST